MTTSFTVTRVLVSNTASSHPVSSASSAEKVELTPQELDHAEWKKNRTALLSLSYEDLKKLDDCEHLTEYVEQEKVTDMRNLLDWCIEREQMPLYEQAAKDFPESLPHVSMRSRKMLEVLKQHQLPYTLHANSNDGQLLRECLDGHNVKGLTAAQIDPQEADLLCRPLLGAWKLESVDIYRARESVAPGNVINALAVCPGPLREVSLPEFQHGSNGSLGKLLDKPGLKNINIKCEDSKLLPELVDELTTRPQRFAEPKHISLKGASPDAITDILLKADQPKLTLTFITTEEILEKCEGLGDALDIAPTNFAGVEFRPQFPNKSMSPRWSMPNSRKSSTRRRRRVMSGPRVRPRRPGHPRYHNECQTGACRRILA